MFDKYIYEAYGGLASVPFQLFQGLLPMASATKSSAPLLVTKLAQGSEYIVYRVLSVCEDGVTLVMKVPGRLTWHIFHTFTSSTVRRDLALLESTKVAHLKTELREGPIYYTVDGHNQQASFALFQPHVELCELTEGHLSEDSALREQLAMCLLQSIAMTKHGRAIDFTGMKLVGTWIKHQLTKLVFPLAYLWWWFRSLWRSQTAPTWPTMDPTLYNLHLQPNGEMVLLDVGLLPIGDRNVVGWVNQILLVFQTALVQISLEKLCSTEQLEGSPVREAMTTLYRPNNWLKQMANWQMRFIYWAVNRPT